MEKIRQLEKELYREQCRIRCLESSLDRIDYSEFQATMNELEAATVRADSISKKLMIERINASQADYATLIVKQGAEPPGRVV